MSNELLVLVGTYTDNNKSEGVYVCRFNDATGALTSVRTAPKVDSPSFLAVAPDKRHVYAVNETTDGKATAFTLDASTGAMTIVNQESTQGKHPCHIAIDNGGRCVMIANYTSGNLAVLPIQADGSLGPISDNVQQHGTGPDKGRQEGPHAHSITLDAANRHAIAADLGADKLFVYRPDYTRGKFAPNTPPAASLKPGTGPRHIALSPDERFVYAIGELADTVTVFAYDKRTGSMRQVQSISTLPAGFKGKSYCADIHVHPSGRFVYGSNRGHDSIAMYAVEPRTGKLTSLGQEPVRGKWPRNFAVSPNGKFLLVANQNTDNIAVFKIDPTRGRLTFTGKQAKIPAPVCIRFV